MGSNDLLEGLNRLVQSREHMPPEALPVAVDTVADVLTALMLVPRSEAVEVATGLMARGFEGALKDCSTTEAPQKAVD